MFLFGLLPFIPVNNALHKKIDGVANELKVHRADTEAHRGVPQVRED